MFTAKLRELHEKGQLTIDHLADLLSIEKSSAYPYLHDRDPRATQLRQIFRHCGRYDVQAELLNVLIRGTGWIATKCDAELDVTGDGPVDTLDAVKAAAEASKEVAEYLGYLANAAADKAITGEERDSLERYVDAAVKHLMQAKLVVQFLHEQTQPRKRCRPLPSVVQES